MPRSEPKCPGCGWHLSFEVEGDRWVARCWNPTPGGCARAGRVVAPPRYWEAETLAVVQRLGRAGTRAVAAALGMKLPAASERLRALYEDGVLTRTRVGRNAFEYSLAPSIASTQASD